VKTVMTHRPRRAEPSDDAELDLAAIWADVGASVARFVRRRVQDPHQADDIVADVMVRIHQHLGTLDDRERVTAWVFRIARNAITDHYRRNGRRREIPIALPEPPGADSADAWLSDSSDVLAEIAACVRPLVAALPDDYRRALELTDLDGRTQADAARLEGISFSGMKSRVQRGRRQIADLIQQCCEVTTDARGGIMDVRQRPDGCGCPPSGSPGG
jgi:RNA polymerase sigma-70 factor (ECF subfamily)